MKAGKLGLLRAKLNKDPHTNKERAKVKFIKNKSSVNIKNEAGHIERNKLFSTKKASQHYLK